MDRLEFSNRLLSTVIPEGTPPEDVQGMTRPVSEAICQMLFLISRRQSIMGEI